MPGDPHNAGLTKEVRRVFGVMSGTIYHWAAA